MMLLEFTTSLAVLIRRQLVAAAAYKEGTAVVRSVSDTD